MSLQGGVPQTLPTMPLQRTGLGFGPEESQMESLSLGTFAISNQPLSKSLRLRSKMHSTDEESRIESSKPKTLAVPSKPIPRETMTTEMPEYERRAHIADSIREETQKFFDEIIPSTPCIFLCWGRPEDCRVIQIPLKNDGTWSFQELHDAWYAARGKWRRWLPIFGIVSVEPVQIQFAGRLKYRKQNRIESRKKNDDEPQASSKLFSIYSGIYNPLTPRGNKDSLEKELLEHISHIEERTEAAEHAINHDIKRSMGYDDTESEYPCYICPTANKDYNDIRHCPSNYDPERYESCEVGNCEHCDESARNQLFDKIANDRRRSMITLCFRDPSLNVAPHITFSLNRWVPDVVGVVTQLNLLEQLKYGHQVCRISNIAVPGLVIHEDWLDWRESVLPPLLICFFFAIVVGSRFLFGDWQTGLTAGGCFVAFLAIPALWISHVVRR